MDNGSTLGMDRFGMEHVLPDERRVETVLALDRVIAKVADKAGTDEQYRDLVPQGLQAIMSGLTQHCLVTGMSRDNHVVLAPPS